MRLAPIAVLFAAALSAAPAFADLGPRPSCPKGEHHEYLMGHRCVPDGSHLEQDSNGGVKTVPDKALNASPPTRTAASTASAAPASSADPAVPPTTPPANRGCACSTGDGGGTVVGLSAALGAALVFGLRRRAIRRRG